MVIDIEAKLVHPKKGAFRQDFLEFIPDAADINETQLCYLLEMAHDVMENNVVPDMIQAGIYKSRRSVERALKNGALEYEAEIRVIVDEGSLEEAIPGTEENVIGLGDGSRAKIVIPGGMHTIVYHYYHKLDYVTRGKLWGGYYFGEYWREEWSDSKPDQVFYQLGDIIRFRHKGEVEEGIICNVWNEEYFEAEPGSFRSFYNVYEVVLEKPTMDSEWDPAKEKWVKFQKSPYTFYCFEDDVVHANDVMEVLGYDYGRLVEILREDSYSFTTEYLKKIGVIEEGDS